MSPIDGAVPLTVWQGPAMELKNALTTSSEASRRSKQITYSTTAASQGSVILPPSLVNPNSSRDMSRSSAKTGVPRYANGTSNLRPSAEYTTQRPLPATAVDVLHGALVSFIGVDVSRILARAA